MKAILNASLTVLLMLATNLIGLIALAAAGSVLLHAGTRASSHQSHHTPVAHVCSETCPIHPPSS